MYFGHIRFYDLAQVSVKCDTKNIVRRSRLELCVHVCVYACIPLSPRGGGGGKQQQQAGRSGRQAGRQAGSNRQQRAAVSTSGLTMENEGWVECMHPRGLEA